MTSIAIATNATTYSYISPDGTVTTGLSMAEAWKMNASNHGQGMVIDRATGDIKWDKGMPAGYMPPAHATRMSNAVQLPDSPVMAAARSDSNEYVTMLGQAGTVSEEAKARIEDDQRYLEEEMGFKLPPPVYAPGSRVNEWGTKNFATSRQKHEAQPLSEDALMGIVECIEKEQRQDIILPAKAISMLDDGSIAYRNSFDSGELQVEEEGLRHLTRMLRCEPVDAEEAERQSRLAEAFGYDPRSKVFPRGATLMAAMPTDLRATVFNRMMERVDGEHYIKLRTRSNGSGRSLFACVGEKYSVCDADVVATALATALSGSGARGNVTYDPATTTLRAEATFHVDKIVDFAAGDIFKVGGVFGSNDAAGGSITGNASVWRNLCLNLIIIGTASKPLFNIQHRGSMEDMQSRLREGIRHMDEVFARFTERWGVLRQTQVQSVLLWGEKFDSVPDALGYMVANGKIDKAAARDAMVEGLLQSYNKEPGDSLADIVNAVTRYAHEGLLSDIKRDALERSAGALMPALVRAAA